MVAQSSTLQQAADHFVGLVRASLLGRAWKRCCNMHRLISCSLSHACFSTAHSAAHQPSSAPMWSCATLGFCLHVQHSTQRSAASPPPPPCGPVPPWGFACMLSIAHSATQPALLHPHVVLCHLGVSLACSAQHTAQHISPLPPPCGPVPPWGFACMCSAACHSSFLTAQLTHSASSRSLCGPGESKPPWGGPGNGAATCTG
jgi:hypothetical protein